MKASEEIKILTRAVRRSLVLEGEPVACADGVFLVDAREVTDPRPIVDACRAQGLPTSGSLRAGMLLRRELVPVDAATLVALRRDLKRLSSAEAQRVLRAAGRRYAATRDGAVIDRAWVAAKEEALERVAATATTATTTATASPSGSPPRRASSKGRALAPPRWVEAVASVVRAARGADAAARFLAFVSVAAVGSAARLADARGRLEALAATPADELPDDLRALAKLPGRARARRVQRWLRSWLGLPEHAARDTSVVGAPPTDLRDHARAIVAALERDVADARTDRAARVVACVGAYFDVVPEDGAALESPDARALAERTFQIAIDQLRTTIAAGLRVADALWLLERQSSAWERRALAHLLAGGLPRADLEKMEKLGRLAAVLGAGRDVDAARAYCRWAEVLVPHYKALGLDPNLDTAVFAQLSRARHADMAVLAHCLLVHHVPSSRTTAARDRASAEEHLAVLDATVALFRKVPDGARRILGEIAAPEPGAGRRALPAFAEWLGDDALLDKYLHVARIAGESATTALSKALLRDFTRVERLSREHDYLASLASPDRLQRARVAWIERSLTEPANGPAWTRRKLAERASELTGRAYARRLDSVLRDVIQAAFGIAVPAMTDTWRDVVRFYLVVDTNRDHLQTLVRYAASHPGQPIARALSVNVAWLERAAEWMNVDAWLAPRSKRVVVGGAPYVLSVEQDPLEVLRMGIPFDTCLSLEGGENAASTVVNALDANKHVLYLRDEKGSIVARLLVAVSKDKAIVGYHRYIALDEAKRPEIERCFADFVRELADACGLPIGREGSPEQLHAGFWYDDGVEPLGVPASGSTTRTRSKDVAAYCAALGRAVPEPMPERLAREARAWAACQRGDVDAAVEALGGPWFDGTEAAAWVVSTIGVRRAVERTAKCEPLLVQACLAATAGRAREVEPLLAVLPSAARYPYRAGEVLDVLFRHHASGVPLEAYAEAIERTTKRFPATETHGLAHQSFDLFARFARWAPIAEILSACEPISRAWDAITARSTSCASCRARGEAALLAAVERAWPRDRDPGRADAVVAALRERRRTDLARRVALRISARYALDAPFADDPTAPVTCLLPWRFGPPPTRNAVALNAIQSARRALPSLEEEPDLLAAIVRQAATSKVPRPWPQALPTPARAPFDALGDLLLHLPREEAASALGVWASPSCASEKWAPSAWELFWHRRSGEDDPWRVRLRRRAHADRAFSSPSLDWLAMLGDVEAVEAVVRAALARSLRDVPVLPPRGPIFVQGTFPSDVVARGVAEQLAAARTSLGARTLLDRAPATVASSPAKPPPAWLALTVDPETMRRALFLVDHGRGDGAVVDRALDWLVCAGVDAFERDRILERLVARAVPEGGAGDEGDAGDAAVPLVRRWLGEVKNVHWIEPPWGALLGAGRRPELVDAVVEVLAQVNTPSWRALVEQLERAGGERELAERLVMAALARSASRVFAPASTPAEIADAVAIVARRAASPEVIVQLFAAAPSHAIAARIVAAVEASGDPDLVAAFRKAARAHDLDADDRALADAWIAPSPVSRVGKARSASPRRSSSGREGLRDRT